MTVACTCGHHRSEHLVERTGPDAYRRGPCGVCADCDEFTPAGRGS